MSDRERSASRASGPGSSGRQFFVAAALLLLLCACGRQAPQPQAAQPVIALPVQALDASLASQFPGEVHSRYELPLSFRVPGQVSARYARLGDRVKQGQALAKLDDADAVKTQASAQAGLDAAEHRLHLRHAAARSR